jgi:hypothetical protein
MRGTASVALLLVGVLVPCTQIEPGVLGLAEKLRPENPQREIDGYSELMSEHCAGLCLLLPTYPPQIVRVWPEGGTHDPVRAPHPPGGRDWAYEQQRFSR